MNLKKITGLVLCLAVAGVLFTGCSTVKEVKPDKDSVAPSKDVENSSSSEEAGKKMIDSICRGISTGNYPLYSRDFTEKHKEHFDKKIFDDAHRAVNEKLGDYKGIEFIGFWRKGNYDILLWKASFSGTDDDILVQMYVTKIDGTFKIAALKLI
jgi:hypothetical protein